MFKIKSDQDFITMLVVGGIFAIAVGCVILFAAKKKGVNIQNRAFAVSTALSCGFVFMIAPIWFTDLSLKFKILATLAMLLFPLVNVLAIDRVARALRRHIDGGHRDDRK